LRRSSSTNWKKFEDREGVGDVDYANDLAAWHIIESCIIHNEIPFHAPTLKPSVMTGNMFRVNGLPWYVDHAIHYLYICMY